MESEPEVATAPEPKAADPQPQSLPERMAKFAAEQWQGAAPESATADTPSAEEPQKPAEPAGTEPKAAETTPPATPAPSGDDTPFTPEQLADSRFWGSLDKDGWAKAERLHPVETKLVKAAQAAATRIVNAARKEAPPTEPQPPPSPAEEEPPLDPELQQLFETLTLGEPKEQLKAFSKLVEKAVSEVPEVKQTREQQRVATMMQRAHDIAVNGDEESGLQPMPELDGLDDAELDAAYEKDPEAKLLAKIGTPTTIALAMRRVGQAVLANKRESEAKYQAEQDKLRRNADTPASNAVTPRTGGPVPKRGETMTEFVTRQWNEVGKRANS